MTDIKIDLYDSYDTTYKGFSKAVTGDLSVSKTHNNITKDGKYGKHGKNGRHRLHPLHNIHPLHNKSMENLEEISDTEKEYLKEKQDAPSHDHTRVQESTNLPQKVIWRSCCFQLDPRGVAYAGQFTISMTVLGISTYMLLQADGDCNKSSPYIGLISFLLGKILSTVVSSA